MVRLSALVPISFNRVRVSFSCTLNAAESTHPERVASNKPKVDLAAAISTAESRLGAIHNGHPTSVEYFAKDDGDVVLTHVVQLEAEGHWYEAFVDAESGELVAANDFVNDASVSFSFGSNIPQSR